jgi:hypothetical protein
MSRNGIPRVPASWANAPTSDEVKVVRVSPGCTNPSAARGVIGHNPWTAMRPAVILSVSRAGTTQLPPALRRVHLGPKPHCDPPVRWGFGAFGTRATSRKPRREVHPFW